MQTKTCKDCGETRNISEFRKASRCKYGKQSYCKPCESIRKAAHYQANKVHYRAMHRKRHLKTQYGITPQEYDEILARQGGGCAICQRRVGSGRWPRLHVDHDHTTGRVRGLLCAICNTQLGIIENEQKRNKLMEYLNAERATADDDSTQLYPLGDVPGVEP